MKVGLRKAALPAQPTPLVGRQQETQRVRDLLLSRDVRLVTLIGPGGSGKTRLALAVAEALAPTLADGAVFIDLTSARAATEVVPSIARGLGMRDLGSRVRLDHVSPLLVESDLLLVLDNFEHVLGAAPQIAELLSECARLKVLVTSRAPLRVRWEHELLVGPLELPRADGTCRTEDVGNTASAALFVARARAARDDFTLTDQNANAVAAICRRLDGLPLAIELAAARIKVLSTGALLARLDDRLALLTDGARELPPRLQSLRGALDWSYALLGTAEQKLFRQLSVFSGTFSAEAAQAVCGTTEQDMVLDGLTRLVDHSLLRVHHQAKGESRFAMLDTLREYAATRLSEAGEASATHQRHAQVFLHVAEASERHLSSAAREACLRRLERDYENLRSALACLLEHGQGPEACRLVGALRMFWAFDGRVGEGRQWAERSLNATTASQAPLERLKALQSGGHMAWLQGDRASARSWIAEAASLAREHDDRTELATALIHLAFVLDDNPELGADRPQDESLRLFEELGGPWNTALALMASGQLSLAAGSRELGRSQLERSLELWQQVGDVWFAAQTLNVLGDMERGQGEYDRAFDLYSRSLALLSHQESRGNVASVLHNLGYVAVHRHQHQEALEQFSSALDQFITQGDHRGIGECLLGLAVALSNSRRAEDAAALFGAGEALLASAGAEQWPSNVQTVRDAREATRRSMGQARFNECAASGRGMSIERLLHRLRELRAEPPLAAEPRDKAGSLTPRERQIAHLLAAGYTNRQLAETLVLSEQTVETHVKRILGKLELRSRHQIAQIQIPT